MPQKINLKTPHCYDLFLARTPHTLLIRLESCVTNLYPNVSIGGAFTNPTFTKTTFLDSLDVLITHDLPLRVYKVNDGRVQIQRTQDLLLPGEYEVESDGKYNWLYYKRTSFAMSSLSASGRARSFPAAIQDRDRKCVITGVSMTQRELLFPVALESIVNSPQNGLLLMKNVHGLFDQYEISINYTWLDPICRELENPHRVNDNILYWHFQQADLANMRRAGEPIFDEDIPPGSDTMDAILSGPAPAERMEFELSRRLGDVVRSQGSLLIK
ncbi:uncharacterized protein V1513DRAFT_458990 [Lipomyces chichibuensis]|uniref:uncharacterized protein n=1 Tax=Lipomyces chichibuensis TaxID=1546026 RepID=UPI00334346A9